MTKQADQFGGYDEAPSSGYAAGGTTEPAQSFTTHVDAPPAITTGHDLTIEIINRLAQCRNLVSTVALSTRKDGSTMLTFETHPEETK